MTCDNISKVYENGKQALSSINFTVPTRGIMAFIGRNGAGKTTLARILATLLEPSSGTAAIDGLDIMADARELRQRMAVVPQEGRTLPWMTPLQTVSSYLMWRGLGYRVAAQRASEAIARVGLQDHSGRLNRTLSGGMKRKVLVAMVIASGSDLIFLDEPTTGLDPISRQELWDLLTDLGKDRFVFLTTHYLEEAEQVADRIGILDDGRLLAMGSMAELRGQLQHQYSVRVPMDFVLPPLSGEIVRGRDGKVQILTTEEEALSLSRRLIEQRVHFSINPVSLDDIFYRLALRPPNEEDKP